MEKTLEIVTGKRKDGKGEWKALRVQIGEWSTLVFPKSKFEMDYIEKAIKEQ